MQLLGEDVPDAVTRIEAREFGSCFLAFCTLENGSRVNVFSYGKGNFGVWTFLAGGFCPDRWPSVVRLASELSEEAGIGIEITDELDVCCFLRGSAADGARTIVSALSAFISATASRRESIARLSDRAKRPS